MPEPMKLSEAINRLFGNSAAHIAGMIPRAVVLQAQQMDRAFVDARQLGLSPSTASRIIGLHVKRSSETAEPIDWDAVRADMIHEATQLPDMLAAWLYRRFGAIVADHEHSNPVEVRFDQLDDDNRTYWEQQARDVKRAVERNGYIS